MEDMSRLGIDSMTAFRVSTGQSKGRFQNRSECVGLEKGYLPEPKPELLDGEFE